MIALVIVAILLQFLTLLFAASSFAAANEAKKSLEAERPQISVPPTASEPTMTWTSGNPDGFFSEKKVV